MAESRKDKTDGYGTYSRVDLSKSFAQLSLPHPLILQERGASKALGVTAKTAIKAYTRFGPLQGEHILLKDIPEDFEMKELWQVRNPVYVLLKIYLINRMLSHSTMKLLMTF